MRGEYLGSVEQEWRYDREDPRICTVFSFGPGSDGEVVLSLGNSGMELGDQEKVRAVLVLDRHTALVFAGQLVETAVGPEVAAALGNEVPEDLADRVRQQAEAGEAIDLKIVR